MEQSSKTNQKSNYNLIEYLLIELINTASVHLRGPGDVVGEILLDGQRVLLFIPPTSIHETNCWLPEDPARFKSFML